MSDNGGYIDEKPVQISEMDFLISRTDTQGIITYASDDFCKVCGFKKEELVGSPHNVVRHPDMPKAAFEEMWKTIKKNKKWTGVVKNRAKNGGYYWVVAEVSPFVKNNKVIGYKSVRKKASEEQISEASKTYKEMIAKENGIVNKWSVSIEDTNKIMEVAKKYNFENDKLVKQMIKLVEKRLAQLAKGKTSK